MPTRLVVDDNGVDLAGPSSAHFADNDEPCVHTNALAEVHPMADAGAPVLPDQCDGSRLVRKATEGRSGTGPSGNGKLVNSRQN